MGNVIELHTVTTEAGHAVIASESSLKVARQIAERYPEAPYADVEAMAAELIAKAVALSTIPCMAHGVIVRYAWSPESVFHSPVDVLA